MAEMEITVPEQVPVMTLPNTTFFPQALMPLHIFEPRYQGMLRDVLATNRLFAVARLKETPTAAAEIETPYRVASLGIVRACQKNDDGTSNLLIQGLCRVKITEIICEAPYRQIRIQPLTSAPGASEQENEGLRRELTRLLSAKARLSHADVRDMMKFLKTVQDPEAFVDIAAFSMCESAKLKQKLLETLDVHHRLRLFGSQLRTEIEGLKLQRKLQGPLADDRVCEN